MSPAEGTTTGVRASRACVACRSLKSRCVGLDDPPCNRCRKHGLECKLLPSQRGKTPRTKRTDGVSSSVRMKKMQETLDAVLRTLGSGATGEEDSPELEDVRPAGGSHSESMRTRQVASGSSDGVVSWDYIAMKNSVELSQPTESSTTPRPFLNLSPSCPLENLPDNVLDALARARTQASDSTTDQELLAQLFGTSVPSPPLARHLSSSASPPNSQQRPAMVTDPNGSWFDQDAASLNGGWPKHEQLAGSPTNVMGSTSFNYSLASISSGSPANTAAPRLDKAPLELLAEVSRARLQDAPDGKDNEDVENPGEGTAPEVGIASDKYFQNEAEPQGRMRLRTKPVCAELGALLDDSSQRQLFKIFMEHMNAHSRILNEIYHTFERVVSRSEFLLSAICAAAAKFLPSVQHMQTTLTKLTVRLSRGELGAEWRSVETIQAFLTLAIFGTDPGESAAADPLWYHLGSALRMAIDINLHRKSHHEDLVGLFDEEEIEAEILNRERTFILLYSCDRSTSAQRNKPVTLQENWLIRGVSDWGWKLAEDRRTSGYAELQTLSYMFASVFRPEDGEGNVGCLESTNFTSIFVTFERQLALWKSTWQRRSMYLTTTTEANYQRQLDAIEFYEAYNRLLLCSFGLQHDLLKRPIHMSTSFQKCRVAATEVLRASIDRLGETMKYSPNAHFLFSSYAAMYLLKLASMRHLSTDEERAESLATIEEFIQFLHRIAANRFHTPNLYARFLINMVRHFKRSHQLAGQKEHAVNNLASAEDFFQAESGSNHMLLDFNDHVSGSQSLGYLPMNRKQGGDDWAQMLFPDVFDSMPSALGLMDGLASDHWA